MIVIAPPSKDRVFSPSEVINHITETIETDPDRFVRSIDRILEQLWARGLKIKAIMLLRALFPMGLREAKDYIEERFE